MWKTTAAPAEVERVYSATNAAGAEVFVGTVRNPDPEEPMDHATALRVGTAWLELPESDGTSFLQAIVDGPRWLLFFQFDTEAAGPITILASEDGGRTFGVRGEVRWPNYMAGVDSIAVKRDEIDVAFTADDVFSVGEEDWTLLERVRAKFDSPDTCGSRGPGRYRMHSDDGGRSFELRQ